MNVTEHITHRVKMKIYDRNQPQPEEIHWEIKVDGYVVWSRSSCDTVVHPSHRREIEIEQRREAMQFAILYPDAVAHREFRIRNEPGDQTKIHMYGLLLSALKDAMSEMTYMQSQCSDVVLHVRCIENLVRWDRIMKEATR